MPTDFAFRLSTYLTLALACGGLAYAETGYLPEAAAFGALVVVAIGLAFWADRAGRSLSLAAADWVGGGLFALTVSWIGYHIFVHHHPILNTWPAGLLPFLGPVLMLATVAKLCRPKHVGDWWALQVIGLCSIALAATLTDDEPFVPILFLYLLVLGWSLTLFFIRRASGYVDPVPEYTHFQARAVRWLLAAISPKLAQVPPPHRPTVAAPFAGVGQPTPTERLGRSHLARAAGWMTAAAAVALPLFFLTPRSAGLQWELFKPRLEVGLPTDKELDLSRTGELQPNDEPAFEVTARYPDGRPKELAGTVRWRVSAYSRYETPRGQWSRQSVTGGPDGDVVPVALKEWAVKDEQPRPAFPDLGPGQFLLEYQLLRTLGGMPLLDPVAVRAGQPPTVAYPTDGGYRYPNVLKDGSFHHFKSGGSTTGGAKTTRYLQASAADPADERSGPFPGPTTPLADRLRPYLTDPPTEIKDIAKTIYLGLIQSGRLPAGVKDRWQPDNLMPAAADHAVVARAVRDHLAGSGRYRYTLNLRVQNKSIDPVIDFLQNTREGHCERFAAALVLLLRGLGIPCQFVVGFKGCEPLDDGRYLVRQEHAHAWAEVLVWQPSARPREPNTDGRDWYWLSLDPTPDTSSADELERTKSATSDGRRLIADLLLGLNPERQKQLAAAAADMGRRYGPATAGGLLAVGLLVVGYLTYRRVGRRAVVSEVTLSDDVPWFARLVQVLTAAGVPPPDGRTPKEYAAAAAAHLAADPRTAEVADVPSQLAELVYATRYAGRLPTADELAEADAALVRLAAVSGRSG